MINLLKTHKDKVLHFLGCFFLTSIWLPLGIGFAIGKEVWDWFDYGRKLGLIKFLPMALSDLIADGIGIIMGIILVLGVRHGIF